MNLMDMSPDEIKQALSKLDAQQAITLPEGVTVTQAPYSFRYRVDDVEFEVRCGTFEELWKVMAVKGFVNIKAEPTGKFHHEYFTGPAADEPATRPASPDSPR